MLRVVLSLLVVVGLYGASLEGIWQMDANYSIARTKDDFVKILLVLMEDSPQKLRFESNGSVFFEAGDGTVEKGRYYLHNNRLRLRFGSKVREGELIYPHRLYLRYPMGKSDFRLYFTNLLLSPPSGTRFSTCQKKEHNLTAEANQTKPLPSKRTETVHAKKSAFPLIKDKLYRSVKKVGNAYIYALFSSGGHFSWIALSSAKTPTPGKLRHQERYFFYDGKVILESDGHRIRVQSPSRFSLIMKDRIVDFKRN